MPTSQNGWQASATLRIRPLIIDGIQFAPGIRDDDNVAFVLGYVLTQYHRRVEPLVAGWCWGYSYRPNVNNPTSLSNHSSGTAVDANAPAHPNGVPTADTFTAAQIVEVHRILAEAHDAVRWGGDYTGNPDAMHFEINVNPTVLAATARQIRNDLEAAMPLNADDEAKVRTWLREELAVFAKTAGTSIKVDMGDTAKWSLERALKLLKVKS